MRNQPVLGAGCAAQQLLIMSHAYIDRFLLADDEQHRAVAEKARLPFQISFSFADSHLLIAVELGERLGGSQAKVSCPPTLCSR